MLTPLFGRSNTSPSTSVVNYLPITSTTSNPLSAESSRQSVIPAVFTLKNFYINIDVAPGTAKSYTFTIRKNNADTAITVTISNSATSGTYTGTGVSFGAGDIIDMSITPSGTPSAPSNIYWNLQADSGNSSHFSLLTGNAGATTNLSTSAVSYANIAGASASSGCWSATELNMQIIVPCSGTLQNLYVTTGAAPGTGKSYAITVNQNGSATSLVATVSGTNTSANDTNGAHAITVNAGDTITVSATPSGTPAVGVYSWGIEFIPTTPGQSFTGFGSSNAASASATNYELPMGLGSNAYTTTESSRQVAIGACLLQALYTKLGTAPGGATSRTVTVRKNTANSALVTAISGANTTGNSTGANVGLTQTDLVDLAMSVSGSPAADTNGVHTGLLMYIPISGQSAGNAFLTMMG